MFEYKSWNRNEVLRKSHEVGEEDFLSYLNLLKKGRKVEKRLYKEFILELELEKALPSVFSQSNYSQEVVVSYRIPYKEGNFSYGWQWEIKVKIYNQVIPRRLRLIWLKKSTECKFVVVFHGEQCDIVELGYFLPLKKKYYIPDYNNRETLTLILEEFKEWCKETLNI